MSKHKTPWQELQGLLHDSDNCQPDNDQFLRAMGEFLNDGAIQQYWFADFHNTQPNPNADEPMVWDTWAEHYASVEDSWEFGPDPKTDVDWTGFQTH